MFPPACNKKKSVHFETLGCRLNQIETEGAAEFFFKNNWLVQMKPVAAKDAEDDSVCLCVLNTCAVTGKAEQKARRTINLLLKKFPAAALIVTGCYAQLSAESIQAMDERVVVLPGKAKSVLARVPEFLEQEFPASSAGMTSRESGVAPACESGVATARAVALSLSGLTRQSLVESPAAIAPFELNPKTFFAHSRASLKIQDGCDNSCSYCAIRLARGKSVSIDAATALKRAADLEKSGQAELVITGVNIGQYRGLWQGRPLDLAGFLQLILEETKNIAVRISSIYPQSVTPAFCAVIKNPRVRPHFHISVQSGSDAVLKRMNRSYTRQTVVQACRRLKEAKQNPFLACDIIAGFPGESEADFADTLSLLKEAGFANAHAFPYSPRPGTAAAAFTPKIPERIKDQRVAALNEWSAQAKIDYINSFAGKTLRAVAESVRNAPKNLPAGKRLVRAMTENFIHAEILLDQEDAAAAPLDGQPIMVKILSAKEDAVRQGAEWEALAALA